LRTKPVTTLVLPGLDGSGLLLDRFQQLAPPTHNVEVRVLPDDPAAGYFELLDHFSDPVREFDRCVLIGESFSGPLAILLAHRFPEVVSHLVLVASFAVSPAPLLTPFIPWSLVFRLPLPSFVARRFLLGNDHDDFLPKLRTAIRQASSATLSRRMHAVSNVDVRQQLGELSCPITYIRATQDVLVKDRSATTISEINDKVVIRRIDGPHLILQTQPEQSWNCIADTPPTAEPR